jgi:hypothetical protein
VKETGRKPGSEYDFVGLFPVRMSRSCHPPLTPRGSRDTLLRDRMCLKWRCKPTQDKHRVYPHQSSKRACYRCADDGVRSLADNVPNWVRMVTAEPLRKLRPVKG